jgi:putative two-component system response regulator
VNERVRKACILIVDDEPANVALLSALLARWKFSDVTATSDSAQVVELCERLDPDLVFLDLHMPALRARNLLEMRMLHRDLARHAADLEGGVRERTRHLEQARLEVLQRLALAAEYRDDDTGEHTLRVARTSARLARVLGLPSKEVGEIALAAPLHDIGKMALRDSILLKPGPLSPDQYEQMKSHVRVGAEILAGSSSSLLQTAEEIASTHHERWDGSGYLRGLRGEEIPLAGRIVAVADVFDALTHRRPYKDPWPLDEAVAEVISCAGTHFDPVVVAAFATLDHRELVHEPPLRDEAGMRLRAAV